MPQSEIVTLLSTDEFVRLQVIEGRLETNLRKMQGLWEQILEDLVEIDTNQLYRATHTSFADYWRDRWGRTILKGIFDDASVNYNNRRVRALQAAAAIVPVGTEYVPRNERQARELARLDTPELQQEAAIAAHAIANGNPTSTDYCRAASAVKRTGMDVETGDRIFIHSPASPHHGAECEVIETGAGLSGTLVRAQIVGSNEPPIPLMRGECSTTPPAYVPDVIEPKTRPLSGAENLAFRLECAEALITEYRDRLAVALEELERYPIDDESRALIQETRDWME